MHTALRKLFVVLLLAICAPAAWADTIKIAYIEGVSGPLGNVGQLGANNLHFIIDQINAKGGVAGHKFEMVVMDSKMSPQEALVQLKSAIDQGIQIVTQGNGSSVAGALIGAINKHNERNPDKRVLYLNFAAIDPSLTNEKCSYWHFAFDANSAIKMSAITDAMKADKGVKKVYLINQDYAHGHQVAALAKEMLATKRPDVKVVGSDLHPLGRVKDFAPYVAKIRAAGADTVITGNWGADLTLLVRAAKDSGLDVDWYTYYAGAYGSSAAIGDAGIGKVKVIVEWGNNIENPTMDAFYAAYKKKFTDPKDEFYYYRMKVMMEMLGNAIVQAKSTAPIKIAAALEGMSYKGDMGEVTMRKEDHQLLQPMFIPTFGKTGSKGIKVDLEGSGFGFGNPIVIPAKDAVAPTTCKMERPAS